jgi:hypothetical protein
MTRTEADRFRAILTVKVAVGHILYTVPGSRRPQF